MKIKGFDKDLRCRGMQYEVGKEYKTNTTNIREKDLCTDRVLHYCDSLINVHEYYSCESDNRYCEIEVLGEEVTDGLKFGSNHIRIVREIIGEELNSLMNRTNGNTGLFNTGNRNSGNFNSGNRNYGNFNSGDFNSGDWNTGCWNTGNRNSGNFSSGDCNTGYWNTGNRNSGNFNSGDWNTGYWNTGNRNTGHFNSGNKNTGSRNAGYWNTGDCNAGNCNTGDFNSCNNSNGFFCNEEDRNIRIFNTPSGMSMFEFKNSKYYKVLTSSPFKLTEWVEYTDEEKKEDIDKAMIGGYLKEYTYKEACEYWWSNLTEKNKMIILSIPNFDKEVFEDITGIKI